jgi:lipopolysaccharide biosynthesis glycosyltransferase
MMFRALALVCVATLASAAGKRASMHVAYTINYANRDETGFSASIASLVRHLQRPQACTIHLVIANRKYNHTLAVLQEQLDCLRRALHPFPAVQLHKMLQLNELSDAAVVYNERARQICCCGACGNRKDLYENNEMWLSHLFFERQFPGIDKLLYVDSDTVVTADVEQLLRQPMKFGFGGRPSPGIKLGDQVEIMNLSGVPPSVLKQLVPDASAPFVNCGGSLLLDLSLWRLSSTLATRREFVLRSLAQYQRRMISYDQSVLNILFTGQTDMLEGRWNMVGATDYTLAGVYHFATRKHWLPWLPEEMALAHGTTEAQRRVSSFLWNMYQPRCNAMGSIPGGGGR